MNSSSHQSCFSWRILLLADGLAIFARAALGAEMVSTSAQAEPFWGEHQGGIVTPEQHYTYFVPRSFQTRNFL
jgi:hypothetical protein